MRPIGRGLNGFAELFALSTTIRDTMTTRRRRVHFDGLTTLSTIIWVCDHSEQ